MLGKRGPGIKQNVSKADLFHTLYPRPNRPRSLVITAAFAPPRSLSHPELPKARSLSPKNWGRGQGEGVVAARKRPVRKGCPFLQNDASALHPQDHATAPHPWPSPRKRGEGGCLWAFVHPRPNSPRSLAITASFALPSRAPKSAFPLPQELGERPR